MSNIDTPKQKPIPDQPKSRIDELMDQPCANPRYGGITVREAVLRLRKRLKTKPVNLGSELKNNAQTPRKNK